MSDGDFTVFIVDDDPGVLRALARLLAAAGHRARTFASPEAFLSQHDPAEPGCAVFDVAMPEVDGLELQRLLFDAGIERPIIFVTGQGDIPTSVRAMRAGAADFLTKPFRHQDLLAAIRGAIGKDQQLRPVQAEKDALQNRLATLTPREREVFDRVLKGLLNKQIAGELGASEQTVKVHRGRVMQKMQVSSVAELVQAAVKIGVLKP